jgi:hypothetical protein
VVQVIVAPDEVIEVALTPEITGGADGLFTVTETLLLVVLFPAASLATAVSVWATFVVVVVFHEIL